MTMTMRMLKLELMNMSYLRLELVNFGESFAIAGPSEISQSPLNEIKLAPRTVVGFRGSERGRLAPLIDLN
jgi:hypothetical protein